MNREIRDLLCELMGALWTLSECSGGEVGNITSNYAERIANLLNAEDSK